MAELYFLNLDLINQIKVTRMLKLQVTICNRAFRFIAQLETRNTSETFLLLIAPRFSGIPFDKRRNPEKFPTVSILMRMELTYFQVTIIM